MSGLWAGHFNTGPCVAAKVGKTIIDRTRPTDPIQHSDMVVHVFVTGLLDQPFSRSRNGKPAFLVFSPADLALDPLPTFPDPGWDEVVLAYFPPDHDEVPICHGVDDHGRSRSIGSMAYVVLSTLPSTSWLVPVVITRVVRSRPTPRRSGVWLCEKAKLLSAPTLLNFDVINLDSVRLPRPFREHVAVPRSGTPDPTRRAIKRRRVGIGRITLRGLTPVVDRQARLAPVRRESREVPSCFIAGPLRRARSVML